MSIPPFPREVVNVDTAGIDTELTHPDVPIVFITPPTAKAPPGGVFPADGVPYIRLSITVPVLLYRTRYSPPFVKINIPLPDVAATKQAQLATSKS